MIRRVLVVLDGAPVAERILPWVRRLLSPIAGDVRLLAVLPPPRALAVGARTVTYAHQREDAAGFVAALRLETLAAGLRDDGLMVSSEVRVGEPVSVVLDAAHAWGAEMIAMAEAPRRGWRRLQAGVAEEIVRKSPLPVLVSLSPRHRAA
jgi:nucleotide-binding universal stress UspA family protein